MRKILESGDATGVIGKLLRGARYAVIIERTGGTWQLQLQVDGSSTWVPIEAEDEAADSKTRVAYIDTIPNATYRIHRTANGNAEAYISEPMFVR